ncbi:hypothetical protein Q0P93_14690, partial [Staphylococcus aureus]|nr:hypothetical protein [Staphylococcus aureus]
EQHAFTGPARQALRAEIFTRAEAGFAARAGDPGALDTLRRRALDHLHRQVPDPALRERLRPDYEIGCKRVLLSDDYYPALASDDVTLEPTALARV